VAHLFDKFRNLKQTHRAIVREGRDPLAVRVDRVISPTEAVVEGRHCILLGSNNYLGLTFDAGAVEAARAALVEAGVGTTGSRVANGSYADHRELEKALAAFYGRRSAILFTTGYQANVGFLSAIGGRDDTILIDSDCHASIYDGCQLGHATVLRFRHNDARDLDRRLARLDDGGSKLVVVEGIYSMLGDRAPLADIVAVAERHGASIMVDEAHSLGVLGRNGRGLAEEVNVEDHVDFIVGTLSKSVGTIGGFCISNHPDLDLIRLAARSYLFTASLPPSVVASARATLERIRTNPQLRADLWRNAEIIYDGLVAMGYGLGPDKTPVMGVRLPDVETALTVWSGLLDSGVYVNLALPPATPNDMCLLRVSVCAAHTEAQLAAVLDAFASVKARLDDDGRTIAAE